MENPVGTLVYREYIEGADDCSEVPAECLIIKYTHPLLDDCYHVCMRNVDGSMLVSSKDKDRVTLEAAEAFVSKFRDKWAMGWENSVDTEICC